MGADCPNAVPALGAACSVEGQVCRFMYKYKDCDECAVEPTEYVTVVRCQGLRWGWIAHRREDAGCPITAPREGQACSWPDRGTNCYYSRRDCAPHSISQCDGHAWHALNPCPTRAPVSGQLALSSPTDTALKLAENYTQPLSVDVFPSLASLGTQISVAHTAFEAQWGLAHLYGSWPAGSSSALGPAKPGTRPVVAFGIDRLLVAHVSRAEGSSPDGLVARTLPLRVTLGSKATIDASTVLVDKEATDALDLLVDHGTAYLTYRHPGATESHRAVSLATWELDRPQQTLKRTVLFDEGAGAMNCDDGGCSVVAKLAASPGGPVLAFVTQGPGDFAPVPPRLVVRHLTDGRESELDLTAHIDSLSMASLADGSLLLATFRAKPHGRSDVDPTFCDQVELYRLSSSGQQTVLPCPDMGTVSTPYPPQVVPFESGYALAWHSSSPYFLDQPNLSVASFDDAGQVSKIQIPYLKPRGPFALGASALDRSLHVVWSTDPPNAGASGYQVCYQRLICAPNKK